MVHGLLTSLACSFISHWSVSNVDGHRLLLLTDLNPPPCTYAYAHIFKCTATFCCI